MMQVWCKSNIPLKVTMEIVHNNGNGILKPFDMFPNELFKMYTIKGKGYNASCISITIETRSC